MNVQNDCIIKKIFSAIRLMQTTDDVFILNKLYGNGFCTACKGIDFEQNVFIVYLIRP